MGNWKANKQRNNIPHRILLNGWRMSLNISATFNKSYRNNLINVKGNVVRMVQGTLNIIRIQEYYTKMENSFVIR